MADTAPTSRAVPVPVRRPCPRSRPRSRPAPVPVRRSRSRPRPRSRSRSRPRPPSPLPLPSPLPSSVARAGSDRGVGLAAGGALLRRRNGLGTDRCEKPAASRRRSPALPGDCRCDRGTHRIDGLHCRRSWRSRWDGRWGARRCDTRAGARRDGPPIDWGESRLPAQTSGPDFRFRPRTGSRPRTRQHCHLESRHTQITRGESE